MHFYSLILYCAFFHAISFSLLQIEIRNWISQEPAPNCKAWHDGSRMHSTQTDNLDGPIVVAYRLTAAEPEELSYGEREDTLLTAHATQTPHKPDCTSPSLAHYTHRHATGY